MLELFKKREKKKCLIHLILLDVDNDVDVHVYVDVDEDIKKTHLDKVPFKVRTK
jgi:hypothetical protein